MSQQKKQVCVTEKFKFQNWILCQFIAMTILSANYGKNKNITSLNFQHVMEIVLKYISNFLYQKVQFNFKLKSHIFQHAYS